jgi:carotenoid cleavage dioxygenase
MLALEEGHGPIEIDPDTLDTRGRWAFDGALPRNMTAHPRIDPATGEMWLFANFPAGRLTGDIGLYVADASGAIVRSETVAGPLPALIHDFAIAERFVIFVVSPATVSMKRAMAGGPLIAWEPGLGTHVGVMPRAGAADETRWFAAPTRMVWHLMNAFDEAGRITVDLCEQEAAAFPLADGGPPDMSKASQYLARWELDWDGPRQVAAVRLSDERCEYPRFDERRTGRSYRHGYVACQGGPGSNDLFHRGLGVFDHEAGAMRTWSAGPHCAVAEPVFAPRAGGAEGEGYLLTNIYDEVRNASHLAIFDAQAIESGPIARGFLDHRVPVGFHGLWKAA